MLHGVFRPQPARWQHPQLCLGSSDDASPGVPVCAQVALSPPPPPRPTPDQLAVMLHLLPLEGGVRWGDLKAAGSHCLPLSCLA